MPSLILHYYPEYNFGVSVHDGEVTLFQGTYMGAVKFTPETWDTYINGAVGKALPREYEGFGWYKYAEDAARDGLPWVVMNLRPRESRGQNRIDYLSRSRGEDVEVIFDERVRCWMGDVTAGVEIPTGVDRFAIADRLIELYESRGCQTLTDADLVGVDLIGGEHAMA